MFLRAHFKSNWTELKGMLSINPPVFAHRGANQYAPENTIAAFLKAQELGVRWVEFDVMLSKDQQVVVFHDDKLNRTSTGKGYVHALTYEDLRTLDAGSWFNRLFKEEKIPSFIEVIDFLKKHNMGANVEIKAFPGMEILTVEKVLTIMEAEWSADMLPPLISSFSLLALQTVKKISNKFYLGLLLDKWIKNWKDNADLLQCASVHLNQKIATPARVSEIKSAGFQVYCYTVNDRMRAEELFDMGVDALFSDWPDVVVDL